MNTPKPDDSASVPGPFERDEHSRNDIIRGKTGYWVARMARHLEESERDHLIDLLNKGTHFDEMLAALTKAVDILDDIPALSESERDQVTAAHTVIAKADTEPPIVCRKGNEMSDREIWASVKDGIIWDEDPGYPDVARYIRADNMTDSIQIADVSDQPNRSGAIRFGPGGKAIVRNGYIWIERDDALFDEMLAALACVDSRCAAVEVDKSLPPLMVDILGIRQIVRDALAKAGSL